ncbi:hypothetical protein [Ferroplasma acidiphilum]|uniref:hypothetical protein n=1 Tax=Ferroplasma acidiphilum TaxID=74969 RepID=UPI0012DE563B|nr:hypothetical protein [Ferroplasma acidiphilum]
MLIDAIREASLNVYPYIKIGSKEEPFESFTSRNYSVNWKFWETYSIFSYTSVINKDGKEYEIIRVDKLLYNDIKNHWPEFYENLNKWNEKIKVVGVESTEITNAIIENIYKQLDESNIKAINSPTEYIDKNQKSLQRHALAVYNFVMNTNINEWPNLYSNIGSSEITEPVKKIAENVKREKSAELKKFYGNVKPFLDTAEGLINDLKKLIYDESIKNNCEYIK